jgi:hypothetical protein
VLYLLRFWPSGPSGGISGRLASQQAIERYLRHQQPFSNPNGWYLAGLRGLIGLIAAYAEKATGLLNFVGFPLNFAFHIAPPSEISRSRAISTVSSP